MKREPLQFLTIKTTVLLAFALTVALWAISGYNLASGVADVESRASDISERYMQAQELLSTVRTQVLLGSVFVRDALLDPDPGTADAYRQRMEETYRAAEQALERYVPVLDTAAERESIARLDREVTALRAILLQVLGTDSRTWRNDARLLLGDLIMPKRDVVLRVSEEVQTLNRSNYVQQQTEIAAIHRRTQQQISQRLAFALAASFGIALIAIFYAGRLENRLTRQNARDIQNAQNLQRLSAKLINAQEEERRHIARELHDEIGQVLTAIKVELAVADRAIAAAGGPAAALKDVRSIADGAFNTVRDLSHLLHPALLDDLGLPAAVDWYLRSFSKRHGIRVDLLHDRMEERLTVETEAAAYRIIQEALTNVARHAHATNCRVYLQRLANTLLVTIEDDGVGFVSSDVEGMGIRQGLGLIGIRERVAHLQGTFRLDTTPGKGTRLTVELPARARAAARDADAFETTDAVMAAAGGPSSE